MTINSALQKRLKPHELVLVNVGGRNHYEEGWLYSYVGEVISYPFKDAAHRVESVMVRWVPGYESTLTQVLTDVVLPCSIKYKYVHFAEIENVEVMGLRMEVFPTDMLRYDHSQPVNWSLVNKSGREDDPRLVPGVDPSFGFDDRLIIAKMTPTKQPHWATERWASFSYRLSPMKTFRFGESYTW